MKAEKVKFNLSNLTKVLKKFWPKNHRSKLIILKEHKNFFRNLGVSKEAAEAKNKDIQQLRLQHTRKISRITTNTYLLNRPFLSSDLFISGARNLPTKKASSLSQVVVNLLNI